MHNPGQESARLWSDAQRMIPGGVNSPVRAFGGVGGQPPFIDHGSGCRVHSIDGKAYIDYVMSWGPLILGHAHPKVVEAVTEAATKGTSFGMPTPGENRLAELIQACFPSLDKVRLVNSGTEAAMSAIRLARGATGRDLILKFEGCYHGHFDGLLAAAGSGLATFAIPAAEGVPAAYTSKTIVIPFGDLAAVEQAFEEHGDDIAGLILEPIGGNMGVVPPREGFLASLRDITHRNGSLLIFDEVITGFRVGLGGAQELYGVTPDLTVLGKIIGGGLPCAAYGGTAAVMDCLAPLGGVYQAGTLSGNPLAVAAGTAMLEILRDAPPYEHLNTVAASLADGLREAATEAGVSVQQNRVGSMQTLFFTESPVTDYASAKTADTDMYGRFFHGMLDRGVHFAPSQFEACFVSTAHSAEAIAQTVEAARDVMKTLAQNGARIR
ncbi:MAG: glutamate-1-semialdehyde 2,1-aminomutase [Lentisphaerae bacterium]|jgi:glutamate-1-semialdehyde 2,1-aminomutase|nr:glutamate-1-semialdehyde 2,1-aminomutase [Lentisphaerota bacterium]MBT4821747.1 glutamate-1-semialdehyde 2,1-aminomutase [Lentisphaerota bacterium]MBT5610961.1 glutamate-1-semialdehyde 2,1-aminomutase [Lentisphaerota bacterium]MBT7062217.1 glutamate-1-semialdehyde 2,1-aminomutase [Lentisphaerota bacterium]MBT7848057.1 glutamate-1-semialdehyde 2,1-aminomutase [Lentisphaerota bacterium]